MLCLTKLETITSLLHTNKDTINKTTCSQFEKVEGYCAAASFSSALNAEKKKKKIYSLDDDRRPTECTHVQMPHNKTRSLAPRLVKEPGCVYDDLTSTCQTLDGIQTGLRPQASCKHTTTVLLSLSPGPRNKPPTRA